jgi:hypothetical protein
LGKIGARGMIKRAALMLMPSHRDASTWKYFGALRAARGRDVRSFYDRNPADPP